MADSNFTTLAARLTEHADSIVNVAAHQLETDLREAAAVIRELDQPAPVVARLVAEIRQAAYQTSDVATAAKLTAMLGGMGG